MSSATAESLGHPVISALSSHPTASSSSSLMSPTSPPPSMEMVVQAIRTLYHDADPREKEKASTWLQALQTSVHAWKVSDELLHLKLDVESCYFAAQTMRTKIQNSFSELPADAHKSLKESLLEHVNNIDEDTDHIIVIQLSVALADLVLQMHEWKNSVAELMQRFGTTRPVALLEILVVLPEEVNSRHLRLGANRREEVIAEIKQSAPIVVVFLEACLTMKLAPKNEVHFRSNIFRCLMSWITLGAIPLDAGLQRNSVISYAFQVLENIGEPANVHEAAADAVCSLLERLEGELDDQRPEGAALELGLFTAVRRLEEPYHLAVAHEDIFKAVNFCRVFTSFGESTLTKVVSQSSPSSQHFALQILDCVLTCCGHPDYEVPDITFNLWYRLSEEVYHRNDDQVTAIFHPYIHRLISALCRHCQMEPDSDGLLEEGEDFTEFRLRVLELIKDVVFILGSSNVFRSMLEYLRAVSNCWESTESALFIMSAVARNINPDDSDSVPQVLESILSVTETSHIAVRHTSLKLVGELGDWIDRHPQYLERILNWLLAGLQDPKLSSEAASALQSICSLCRKHMGPHFEGLIRILGSLNTFHLKPLAANGLIKGVAIILTNMPHEQISAAMRTLCWLQIAPLTAILDGATAETIISRNSDTDPVLYLDRLAAIFRHVTPDVGEGVVHPCQAVIADIWPVLSRVFDTFQRDIRIMERCCRTVRFAVRCVGTQSAPLLEPLVKQMVSLYQSHPHSCFLYLGSILVDEFSHLPGCVPGLLSMVEAYLPVTFQLLQPQQDMQQGLLQGLRNHPDTIDDFFRLNARCLQRSAVPYLQAQFVPSIVECGLMCVSLDHREANASVMKFFFDFLHCGRSKEDRDDFAARSGLVCRLKDEFAPKLVGNLVRAAVFHLPSYTFHDIGDVIYELMLYDRAVFCRWLEEALKTLPTETASGLVTVTRKQLVQFHKEVTSAEEAKAVADAVRQFTRLWR